MKGKREMTHTEEMMQLPSAELWDRNRAMLRRSRADAALMGAVWYAIEQRKLWLEWGYPGIIKCIEELAPRAYSTVTECMFNYECLVVSGRLTFEQFVALIVEHGIRKVSELRKAATAIQKTEPRPGPGQLDPGEVTVFTRVKRWYEFTPDMDDLVQRAIRHIQSRVEGKITSSMAVGLMAGEYCSTKALRSPGRPAKATLILDQEEAA